MGAARVYSSERRMLCAGVAAAILAILAASALTLLYLHGQAEARTATTTRNLAKSMVLTFDGILDAIDVALLASSDEIARQRASGRPDAAAIDAFLARQQQRLPVVPALRATGAGGDIVHGRPDAGPLVSVARRPYFTALRAAPAGGLYVSSPNFGQLSHKWVWIFARPIKQADASFDGVVYSALGIEQIQRVMASFNLGDGASIVLRDAGFAAVAGRIGARPLPLKVGDKALSPELLAALARDPQRGTYSTSRSVLASGAHTFSYERSRKYGFYVWVGESELGAMAAWRRQAFIITGLACAFTLLALGFLLLLGRAWRRQARDLHEIRHLAYYDGLTALPNRRLLLDRLDAAMAANAGRARHGALLLIDLDHFKVLNETLGHDRGDLLLQSVAQRLLAGVRGGDTVARLGGDEFAVLVCDLAGDPELARAQAAAMAETIRVALSNSFDLDGFAYRGSPSIGITLFAGQALALGELTKRADTAMYQAKAAGRNTVRFFDPAMQAAVTARLAMEGDLRDSLAAGHFLLHYQVQVDGDGRARGAEVLLRWQHPLRGMVAPGEFIPLAEESGLILPLGLWVLETACAQLAQWAQAPHTSELSLAVNVSPSQFKQPGFVEQVLGVLQATGADPRRLKLELTEGLLLENTASVIATITALKRSGIRISLDDFGTGFSSLSYLKRLPLDQVKIDQSFVRDLLTDANDVAIVRTIVALGQSLGMEVIAEGVESAAQRDALAAAGCHAYQGYFFGRPMPLERFEQSLRPACAARQQFAGCAS